MSTGLGLARGRLLFWDRFGTDTPLGGPILIRSPAYRFGVKVDQPLNWLRKLRYRILWTVAVVAGLSISLIVWSSLPVIPVAVATVATVALVIDRMAAKLSKPVCWNCADELAKDLAVGPNGRICPSCGALNSPANGEAVAGVQDGDAGDETTQA